MSSGSVFTLGTGINNHYGLVGNFANMTAALPKDFGKVQKSGLAPGVIRYFEGLQPVTDPIRSTITTAQGLNGSSTNLAIADSQGDSAANSANCAN